ncbi:MAG: hypothetical protein CI947_1255 [Halanaerobium sp.]|nr:MAG: hypothetical protein CI947_1255 [Halanaerobium sp.]
MIFHPNLIFITKTFNLKIYYSLLNDQEKEEINYKLQKAVQNNQPVEVKYHEDKRVKTASG